jgi:nucleotide-binding universal stress UspA family protein
MKPPTILLSYDFSPAADEALRWVTELQSLAHGQTVVLHVVDAIPLISTAEGGIAPLDPIVDDAEAALRGVVERAGIEAQARVVLESGVGPVVVEIARSMGADLIAMGTHGRGFLGRLMMGSVAEYVLRNAQTPVIVFHENKARVPEAIPLVGGAPVAAGG